MANIRRGITNKYYMEDDLLVSILLPPTFWIKSIIVQNAIFFPCPEAEAAGQEAEGRLQVAAERRQEEQKIADEVHRAEVSGLDFAEADDHGAAEKLEQYTRGYWLV